MVIFLSKLDDEFTSRIVKKSYYFGDMKTIEGYRSKERLDIIIDRK